MVPVHLINVLLGLVLVRAASGPPPGFLLEPDYFVEAEGRKWKLRKPKLRVLAPTESGSSQVWTIFEDKSRRIVDRRGSELPRLRLSRALVTFDPLTRRRAPIEDWTGLNDAQETEADIRALLDRFAPAAAQALFSSTPFYMARLNGASGHTAEEPNDHQRFVIYMDPFAATGRLHAASTLVHELTHVERYRGRGFHANRAAAVMPKADFILLGAADELAAYQAEAAFVQRFLKSISSEEVHRTVRETMPGSELRWPTALIVLLGFEGPPESEARIKEARDQTMLDIHRQAGRYWDIRHEVPVEPALESTIRRWYSGSGEWKEIAGEWKDWVEAAQPLLGTP